MGDCICEGNWRTIIKESELFLDKLFNDHHGAAHRFIGVMHSLDDYYYCMMSMDGELKLLPCACSLETYGYNVAVTPS